MVNFGKCCICTSSFTIANVTSLKCGHTFHAECIKHWIENSKTCPHCRKKTTQRDLVKLFFDEADLSFTQQPDDGSKDNNDQLLEKLTAQLTEAKENNQKLLNSFEEFQKKIKSLKSELKNEKSKANTLTFKEERIRQLEGMLQEQALLREELQKARARVKASEFFIYLTKKSHRNDEEAIDQYLKNSGEIDAKKFIDLIDGQNKKLSDRIKYLETEIVSLKRQSYEKSEKNRKYKQICADYENEIGNLRARLDVAEKTRVPLRSLENDTQILKPKKSFGFSFVEESPDKGSFLKSAQRHTCKHTDDSTENADGSVDDFFDAKDDDFASLLFDDIDVPVASSMTTGALPRKTAIPKRRLFGANSNFNKSIDILDELEYKQREQSADAIKTRKPPINSVARKTTKASVITSAFGQGIKRFLSDPEIKEDTSEKNLSTPLKKPLGSRDNAAVKSCFEQCRRIDSDEENIEIIQID